ncbi:unnamed protein product [Discosporangium mesarthrocarpum]
MKDFANLRKDEQRARDRDIEASAARIKAASSARDLATGVETFLSFDLVAGNGVLEPLELNLLHATDLDDRQVDDIYHILRNNMQSMYEEAGWGWEVAEKRAELTHPDARFLVARRADGKLAGFSSFRFMWDAEEEDEEDKVDVLYVYELQMAPWAKRRGLGRRIMQTLELLAGRRGMSKVMLTVFKLNGPAMSFYMEKMKYQVDTDSPSLWGRDEPYEILSKATRAGMLRADGVKTGPSII